MKASTFRDKMSNVDPTLGADDLSGLVIGVLLPLVSERRQAARGPEPTRWSRMTKIAPRSSR
jgi:hypothetical protein